MTRRATIAVLLLLAAAPAAAPSPKSWWDRDFVRRKRVVLAERQEWPDAPAARLTLSTGGFSRPDGADVRVVGADGAEIPRAVAAVGPGDLVEVVFPVAPGASEWWLYFGNPRAAEPAKPYVPDRGLLLVTRARAPGQPTDWPAMERIFERSTAVFGGGYRRQVFDSENPFGPSDDYVSDYRGFIECPVKGAYTFFTASDEASFLFVGDRLVAQWPGWHDAGKGAWGEFKGTVELDAGRHPFRYVHVERSGAQVMAAYWQPPGRPKAEVIPPSAFPGHREAEEVATESRDAEQAADFSFRPVAKWGLEDRVYTAVTFKAFPLSEKARCRFDFGDGTQGDGPIATHVFLRGGDYVVSLRVAAGGTEDLAVRTVHVSGEWTHLDREDPDVLARFAGLVARYPGENLAAEDLERADFLLAEAGRTGDRTALLRRAVEKGAGLAPGARFSAALRLGDLCRDALRDLEGASWAFRKASEAPDPGQRLEGQVALAEAWLELGGEPGAARRLLEGLVGTLADRSGDAVRRAWLRLGDARMIAGEGAAAREAYGKALALAGGPENAERILRKAGATRSALTHLETGDLTRATEDLREWEWQDPLDRFLGFHRIVKAKCHRARGEAVLVERELAALLAGNPESEYADEALWLLAENARTAGRTAEADALLERLRRDYPWSPLGR